MRKSLTKMEQELEVKLNIGVVKAVFEDINPDEHLMLVLNVASQTAAAKKIKAEKKMIKDIKILLNKQIRNVFRHPLCEIEACRNGIDV